MAQGAGLVNVVVKDEKWFFTAAGARTEGDGSTAFDVTPREASSLAQAGSLVVASDVKILAADFTDFVAASQYKNRG